MLNNGEDSTGMMWLICGFICPMCETRRNNPDKINPNVMTILNRWLAQIVAAIITHEMVNIVS